MYRYKQTQSRHSYPKQNKMSTEEYIIEMMMEDIELSSEPPPTQPLIEADACAAPVEVDETCENGSSEPRNDERSISRASMMVMAFVIILFIYITLVPIVSLSTSPRGTVTYRVHKGVGWIPLVIVLGALLRSRKSRRDAMSTGAAFLYGICPYHRDTLRRSATEWLASETWEVICETTRDILSCAVSCLKVLVILFVVSIIWSATCYVAYITLRPILRVAGTLLAWELLRLLEILGYIKEWEIADGEPTHCFFSPRDSMSWCDDFQGVVESVSTAVLLLLISAFLFVMHLWLVSVDIFGEQSYYLQCARDRESQSVKNKNERRQLHVV